MPDTDIGSCSRSNSVSMLDGTRNFGPRSWAPIQGSAAGRELSVLERCDTCLYAEHLARFSHNSISLYNSLGLGVLLSIAQLQMVFHAVR